MRVERWLHLLSEASTSGVEYSGLQLISALQFREYATIWTFVTIKLEFRLEIGSRVEGGRS